MTTGIETTPDEKPALRDLHIELPERALHIVDLYRRMGILPENTDFDLATRIIAESLEDLMTADSGLLYPNIPIKLSREYNKGDFVRGLRKVGGPAVKEFVPEQFWRGYRAEALGAKQTGGVLVAGRGIPESGVITARGVIPAPEDSRIAEAPGIILADRTHSQQRADFERFSSDYEKTHRGQLVLPARVLSIILMNVIQAEEGKSLVTSEFTAANSIDTPLADVGGYEMVVNAHAYGSPSRTGVFHHVSITDKDSPSPVNGVIAETEVVRVDNPDNSEI